MATLPWLTYICVTAILVCDTSANNWQVRVFTSNITGAGTDASVYISVYGEFGWSQEIIMDESYQNDNEPDHMDIHDFITGDIGRPIKLLVWHDNVGSGAAWHLNKIELRNKDDENIYTFYANRWLSSDTYDGRTSMELELSMWDIVDELRQRVAMLEQDGVIG